VPGPPRSTHVLKVYREDEELLAALHGWISGGLARGEGSICIARPSRLRPLRARLGGLADLGLLEVDAGACLRSLLVEGAPDRGRFRDAIVPALDRMADLGFTRLRLFGEMVDLLWRVDAAAALRLEELWNELLAERPGLALLCGYQARSEDERGALRALAGRCHSHDQDDHHRVLVIEDHPDVRDLLCEGLALAGCEVTGVAEGAAACRHLDGDDRPPCVIVLDLMMPGMNGWEFREWQRAHPRHGSIPVILVTAVPGAAAEAARLGVDAFLPKPFPFEQLLQRVGDRCATCAGVA
jgi:CheY-like chemotaxis protein